MSVLHAMTGSKASVAQRQLSILTSQLWGEANWQAQLRQTLLGQPRTQLHVQPSPADSWVWGLGRTSTICLWTTPWAPCLIRCMCQVAISLRKISMQFLGLRRQAILDLHSLECYIRLGHYVTFTPYILQLDLRKIQSTVNRITISNYVLHNIPSSRQTHELLWMNNLLWFMSIHSELRKTKRKWVTAAKIHSGL